jgi:hypothetical protein
VRTLNLDSAAAISPSFLVISESRSLADIPWSFSICFRFEYAKVNQFVLHKINNKTTKRNNSYIKSHTSAFLAASQRSMLDGEHEGLRLVSACFFRLLNLVAFHFVKNKLSSFKKDDG